MRYSDLWSVLYNGFLPALTFISVGILVVYLVARYLGRVKTTELGLFLITFGTLGGVLGFGTGNSRQAAVGTVLSALLTFLATVLTYLFGKEQVKHWQPILPYCILAMVLNAFFGLFAGSTLRAQSEARERRYTEWRFQYEHVYMEMQKAQVLKLANNPCAGQSLPEPPSPPY